ncbi:LacI family transcriptional regulator [Murinocardiopsis flavida]|uniref:LacI family transcriptional regulator n=1 Tax=Murinocardiopsis flavida TaxID=645275 RepID=A0A2P8DS34_9ACTN|nr:LacI family DNA-binding transcriptional regulator [Murinocardiopsis flavida]PSL00029.1 LacI family transcriptional regulator [Murinocardiopsis flavida]
MASRPRIKDVARLAGVSEKTVSNVLNDYPHVTAHTRAAVEAAIGELGYRVNLAGRHLRRGRSGIIALAVPELDQEYFALIAQLIIKKAEDRGHTVLIHQTEARRERELAALAGFDADFADGLIFSPLATTPDDLRRHSARQPVVLLGERTVPGLHDHVAIDNIAAAREATRHLLDLGCRRIAAIGGNTDEPLGTSHLRTRGYCAEIEAAGLPVRHELIRPARAFYGSDGLALTRELLDGRAEPPDGLLCFNDHLALGALRAVHEAGLRAPGDIAVLGFDDVDAGHYSIPTLSTIAPDKDALAGRAVALLLERIESGEVPPAEPREVLVGHTLVARESTGG